MWNATGSLIVSVPLALPAITASGVNASDMMILSQKPQNVHSVNLNYYIFLYKYKQFQTRIWQANFYNKAISVQT